MNSRISAHIPNTGRVMSTDGGAHPPEFWAQVTAEHIAPINSNMTGKRLRAAQALQHKIADALEPHHTTVQDKALDHHPATLGLESAESYVDDAMDAIEAAAKGTEWEKHFTFVKTKPDWVDDHLASVAAVGEAHVDKAIIDGLHEPITPEQTAELRAWDRYNLIRKEIAIHFATAQDIAHQYAAKQGVN